MENLKENKAQEKDFGRASFVLGLISFVWATFIILLGSLLLVAILADLDFAGIVLLIMYVLIAFSPIPSFLGILGIILGSKQIKKKKTKQAVLGIIFSCTILIVAFAVLIIWLTINFIIN